MPPESATISQDHGDHGDDKPVRVAFDEGIAVLTLNRPGSLNAVNRAMRRALFDAVQEAEENPSVRALVLTGAGERAFCVGADLKEMGAGVRNRVNDPGGFAGFTRVQRTKPAIAVVNGMALGGGFELALACEMVVAATHATFALPEPSRGIIAAGGGAVRLPRRLPRAIAYEVLLTGATLDAEAALRWGLVNRVTDAESALETGLELARAIGRAAPVAVAATMAVAQAGETVEEAAAWAANDNAVERVRLTDDAREGPRAFAERRDPIWKGQ